MKKKILFVINNDDYVRNYVRSGVLESLSSEFDVSMVAKADLRLLEELEGRNEFCGTFSISERHESQFILLSQLLMWRHRRKSKTFFYRWLRLAGWNQVGQSDPGLRKVLALIKWLLSLLGNPKALRVPLLGNRIVFPIVSHTLTTRLEKQRSVDTLLTHGAYDIVVFPSNAYEAGAAQIIHRAQEVGTPSLALIDNWDNLTSKTVFSKKPDHLGVWGTQAALQAQNIHGFPNRRIHELGTPRFDQYFTHRTAGRPVEGSGAKREILFVGSAMPFDEIGALQSLEQALEIIGFSPSVARVLYRPHPWQHRRITPSNFDETKFAYTVLDPQMKGVPAAGGLTTGQDSGFQPDLSYYPTLLNSVDAVVGPLTTMLFEGALCLRPVLALAYPDGHHFTTSRRYFSHFDGLEDVPGFVFCEDASLLAEKLKEVLSFGPIDAKSSDQITSAYLYRDARPYAERLRSLVREIAI